MKTNKIDCFDINGGALVYKKRKTKQSISGKFLLSQLIEKCNCLLYLPNKK
jgi:hypothetical protein